MIFNMGPVLYMSSVCFWLSGTKLLLRELSGIVDGSAELEATPHEVNSLALDFEVCCLGIFYN